MFAPIVNVLDSLATDRDFEDNVRGQAILNGIQTFGFAFHYNLMQLVLSITNESNQALQIRGQDIVNALLLCGMLRFKKQFQRTRNQE